MSYPITLVTGLPGASKTLWCVSEVEKIRQETGRPVFYHNIEGVTLDWQYLEDPRRWVDLPEGAIFVMDEVHKIFPQRGPGAPPAHVEAFGEIRHKGMSAFLLTQEPMSLDNFIRKRANRHVHLKRKFGFEFAVRYEWQELGDPKDPQSLKLAVKSNFNFPKQYYGTYKSADLHTIQKKPPYKKLVPIVALTIIPIAAIWFLISRFTTPDHIPEPVPAAQPVAQGTMLTDVQQQALAWAVQFHERVKGQPHSAPFYDASMGAATFPKISGCGEVKTKTYYKCFCNTQQGTIITTITMAECRFYLKNGWFDPSKNEDEDEGNSSASGSRLASSDPLQEWSQPGSAAGAPAARPVENLNLLQR